MAASAPLPQAAGVIASIKPRNRAWKQAAAVPQEGPSLGKFLNSASPAEDDPFCQEHMEAYQAAVKDLVGEPHLTTLQCLDSTDADTVGGTPFHPRLISHPRSAEWKPPGHIARYLQVWLCKPLEEESRNQLRAECPQPTILGKVLDTPEFDSVMVNIHEQQEP